MQTDGGGWTLIGRGRQGWVWSESGQNTSTVSSDIYNVYGGTLFTPAFYPSTTVDQILRNTAINTLPDGIRIQRAADINGSTWQEVRMLPSSQTNWTWIFSNATATDQWWGTGISLSSIFYNGQIATGANTHDFTGPYGDTTRLFTWPWNGHNSQRGFAYGGLVTYGGSGTYDYLWEYLDQNHPIPYTQVFVRPSYTGNLAYSVPSGTAGSHVHVGTLGMDFNVSTSPIKVTAVGYFAPSNAIPPAGIPITVGIFDRATSMLVKGTKWTFTNTSPGLPMPGTAMRIAYLNPPVILPANGQYTMAAYGYGNTSYQYGNSASPSVPPSTMNSGNNLISFVGTSRWVSGVFGYPTVVDSTVAQYRAGTFLFTSADPATPIWYDIPNTTNYAGAMAFCNARGRRLCNRAEYCPNGFTGGQAVYGGGKKDGDQWAPVNDTVNNWVNVGDATWPSCQLHTEIAGGSAGIPSWSSSTSAASHRNHVLCCSDTVTLGGPVLWLKADALGLANGTAVSTWTDQTEYGFNLTQGTGANQPILYTGQINGYPAVRFDGSNDFMQGSFSGSITNKTMMAVVRLTNLTPTATSGGGAPVTVQNAAGSQFDAIVYNEYTPKRWLNGTDGFNRTPATVSAYDQTSTGPHLVTITSASSSYNLFQNGGLESSTTWYSPPTITSGTFNVGLRHTGAGNGYFYGDVAEVLVYNKALTDAERYSIETSLMTKYGIPFGRSCNDIRAAGYTTSGVYTIYPTTTGIRAFCDMSTDGGGWTLILNYLHAGGTNPALTVRSNSLPLRNSTSLGGNESSSSGVGGSWGHASSALINSLAPFSELRFYCVTSSHGRVLHFKTSHAATISYFKTGSGNTSGLKTSYTALSGHTALLPNAINDQVPNYGDYAPTYFPFYTANAYHWGIGGANRWECDDFPLNFSQNTFHQIYVR